MRRTALHGREKKVQIKWRKVRACVCVCVCVREREREREDEREKREDESEQKTGRAREPAYCT